MANLPPPSTEQQSVINAILSGNCVTIPSVAGSGKTTTMLQVACNLPIDRRVTIVTYNRSLSDGCRERIRRCGLVGRAWCYTIHGIVGKVAGFVCNDDVKLINIVKQWDSERVNRMDSGNPVSLDILMIDEAQDLRPCFYKALCHIIQKSRSKNDRSACGRVDANTDVGIQMCLVGDPKQMLYDFPTYGDDKASSRYMDRPERYWGHFTGSRTWVQHRLTVSYRLTPHVAAFVNTIWGTSIRGGNTEVKNLPVEYLCRYPFPAKYTGTKGDDGKLRTSFLSELIDEYGADNVMLLAQSVRNENCPIRIHVNELMKQTDTHGRRKYNFHIKESLRGFEGSADVKNKVRVWTFCGSKGCEADCVVIFGFDMMYAGRVHSLNQLGVALSRARKRLVIIHGKSFLNGKCSSNAYYPMLGDTKEGLAHSVYCNGNIYHYDVPPLPDTSQDEIISRRSDLAQQAMQDLVDNKAICLKKNAAGLPSKARVECGEAKELVCVASDFNYFAASEEVRFLSYGTWTKESGVIDRIAYATDVQFEATLEDVSALYGEALVYMVQWDRKGFCPNIETVVNDGILQFSVSRQYDERAVRNLFKAKKCEPLSPERELLFQKQFIEGTVSGKYLIEFLNHRIRVRKKRFNGDKIIDFPVKAIEAKVDDEQMRPFQLQIKTVYEAPSKSPVHWVYLANAVMAFGKYHDKWNQIGTDVETYSKWVEYNALYEGKSRLMEKLRNVTDEEDEFEHELEYKFSSEQYIGDEHNRVVEVQGICDWSGRGLKSEEGKEIDLLEIKFVSELSNVNRLQILVYCALFSLKNGRSCSGMLYNARTRELEISSIKLEVAEKFLLDISQFKYNGKIRESKKLRLKKEKKLKDFASTCKRKRIYESTACLKKSTLSGNMSNFYDLTADPAEKKKIDPLATNSTLSFAAHASTIIDLT